MEKPPELIAFETGREVMEQLRNKHASVSQALEYLCTDIGAPACWHVVLCCVLRPSRLTCSSIFNGQSRIGKPFHNMLCLLSIM